MRVLDRKGQSKDLIGGAVLVTVGLQGVILVMLLFQGSKINQLENKEIPSLVQLTDGKVIQVSALESKQRTPQVLKRFTSETMTGLFNWSGTLPGNTNTSIPQKDPGVEVKGGKRITTSTWRSGFALEESFRRAFLTELSELTPADVFSGGSQVVLVIRYLRDPVEIEKGKWKIGVVADLLIFRRGDRLGQPLQQLVQFNKEIFLQAVEPPQIGETELEKTVYNTREAGLEIYAIRELRRGDL